MHDALVTGGGIAGACAALALARTGLDTAWVAAPAAVADLGGTYDQRIYAISPGNADWLAGLDVWPRLDAGRIEPIRAMEVHGDDGGLISFDAWDAHASALGHIVESSALLAAATAAVDGKVARIHARVAALHWNAEQARATLDDGTTLTARLVVAADGGGSPARAMAGIGLRERSYGQTGVVANFDAERPHDGTARQWFRADGVLAWLPLPGRRISMVWSARDDVAQELLALAPEALSARVSEAGGHALGTLRQDGSTAGFPLRLGIASRMIATRLALVGDAAHVVHPLAGQGLNLGLRDIACLAQMLTGRPAAADCGDPVVLQRYERARRQDVRAMEFVTDGLARLFGVDAGPLRTLRNLGMRLTDRHAWLKRALMRGAM